MNLSSLRLAGFKTFANPSLLEFGPGLTAVVGPNGSGKSNVVDALRWVLGERQAREVRGDVMDDVIFAGSGKTDRTPRGKMNVAEVEIVLDNSDGSAALAFSEISIRRRIVRGGEIEYFINGSKCRRRDIEELLDATGLMVHGYSIIAQHDVDDVVFATPSERRQLLEEAAGIRLYYGVIQRGIAIVEDATRRTETAQGVLDELLPRLAELDSQSAATQAARTIQAEIDGLRGDRDRAQWRSVKRQVKDLTRKLDASREEWNYVNDQAGQVEQDVDDAVREIEALYASEQKVREQIGSSQSSLASLRRRRTLAVERHSEAFTHWSKTWKQALDAAVEREALEGANEKSYSLRESLEQSLALRISEREAAKDRHREAATALEAARADASEANRQLSASYTALEELRNRRQRNELGHESNVLARERATLAREHWESRHAALEKDRQDAQARHAEHERQIAEIAAREEAARLAWESASRALTDASEALELARGHASLEAKKASVARESLALIDRRAGNSPRNRLFECFTLSDTAYVASVETLFGAALFASESASLLSEEDPDSGYLFSAGAPVSDPKSGIPEGATSSLWSLIEVTDPSAAGVLAELAEDVYCFPDRKSACAAVSAGVVAIFPDGSVMTAHRLFRKEEAESPLALAETIRSADFAEARARQEIGLLEAALPAREAEENLAREGYEGERASLAAETSLCAQAALLAETAVKRIAEHAVEQEEIQRTLDQATALVDGFDTERTAIEAELAGCESTRTSLESRIAELRNDVDAKTTEVDMLVGALRASETAEAEARDGRDRLLNEMRERDNVISLHEHQHGRWASRLLREEWNALGANFAYACSGGALEREQIRLEASGEELSAIESARKKRDEERKILEQKRATLQVERGELGARTERLAGELDFAAASFEELSALLASPVEDEDTEGFDLEKNDRELRRFERELSALGPVNPFAPEEAARLHGRVDGVASSVLDLRSACQDVAALSKILERRCADRFHRTVASVSEQFSRFYEELFPGGESELSEVVSDDDEEGLRLPGIELVVRPAGKRRQPLTRLSGGEKALTSLAFLFALQQHNPSPFYVFDEVDASLDDSNVERLVRLLGRLARERQFVVVTHNQLTMHAASRMYGVTVNHQGVSTVLNLTLGEDTTRDKELSAELIGTGQRTPSRQEA